MRFSLIVLATWTAGVVTAHNSNGDVQEMLIESWEALGPTLAAFVLASDATATTCVLGCGANVEPTDCGLPVPIIATHGPSTMHYNRKLTDGDGPEYDFNQDFACVLDAKRAATCTYSYSGPYLTHTQYLAQSSPPYTLSSTTIRNDNLLSAYASVHIVTDTAAILSYGTDVYGQPTSYAAAESVDSATSTGAAQSGVTTDSSQATQTSSTTKTKVLTWEAYAPTKSSSSPAAEASKPADSWPTATMALTVLAAISFGMLIIVGAQ